MEKFFGSISCFPEYKICEVSEGSVVALLPDEKRKKIFIKNISAFLKYFKKNIHPIDIPSEIDIGDIEAQIKKNFALLHLVKNKPGIYCLTRDALNIKVPDKNTFTENCIFIEKEKELNRDFLIEKLIKIGYIRENSVENQGEFSVKGGVISIFVPFLGIVELDFFGDTVESIFLKSALETRKKIPFVDIFPLNNHQEEENTHLLKEYLKDIPVAYIDVFNDPFGKGKYYFISKGENKEISSEKDTHLYEKIYLSITSPLYLKKKKAFIPETKESLSLEVEPLKEGDYIIHEDYGVGIFRGIETREIKGKIYDFMVLEYANNEKIYVSYLHFDKIFKYKTNGVITLDQIGGTSWRNLKKRVKSSLQKVAKQLIKLYTERQKLKRPPLDVENELISQFEESFPFVETQDQLKAINDIKRDLSSDKPMERIVCGDVGFGKTEVAIRGVFINAVNGRQSLVLTPTTVLSYQHYRNFKERLEPFGIRVENLSRLKSKKETQRILKELEEGKIDVIIGTHKALQDNVKFKNLGFLVIDEEHRFGVRAKEKIRYIKKDVDTLYMTATPIPRTLNMALSGFKELSVINTPPEGRVETKTYLFPYSIDKVKEAIKRELDRNGQVFYIHNRIESINQKAEEIKSLFPGRNVGIAHGKMKPKEIEKVLLDFIQKKIDILVSTSIIETGIDIPTANTLIIERADLFGLAQLYHLRGRVGRGNIQAYCYLFVPEGENITQEAEKRLSTIKRLTRPGSGLKISIEDMQIRGVGNILGVEQSGHIKAVGYEMYIKLLKEAIQEESGIKEKEPVIVVDFESYIPQDFIQSPTERLNIYMAVSKAKDQEEVQKIKDYLEEFYNGLPKAFNTYMEIYKLKKYLTGKGIKKVELKKPVSTIYFDEDYPPPADFIKKIIENLPVKQVFSNKVELYIENVSDLIL
jgi:transcription-repair coupling factor (superfamily II helicase)